MKINMTASSSDDKPASQITDSEAKPIVAYSESAGPKDCQGCTHQAVFQTDPIIPSSALPNLTPETDLPTPSDGDSAFPRPGEVPKSEPASPSSDGDSPTQELLPTEVEVSQDSSENCSVTQPYPQDPDTAQHGTQTSWQSDNFSQECGPTQPYVEDGSVTCTPATMTQPLDSASAGQEIGCDEIARDDVSIPITDPIISLDREETSVGEHAAEDSQDAEAPKAGDAACCSDASASEVPACSDESGEAFGASLAGAAEDGSNLEESNIRGTSPPVGRGYASSSAPMEVENQRGLENQWDGDSVAEVAPTGEEGKQPAVDMEEADDAEGASAVDAANVESSSACENPTSVRGRGRRRGRGRPRGAMAAGGGRRAAKTAGAEGVADAAVEGSAAPRKRTRVTAFESDDERPGDTCDEPGYGSPRLFLAWNSRILYG